MDRTKKPKKPPQCNSCKQVGHQANWAVCPNYQQRRAERKREREARDAARRTHLNASGEAKGDLITLASQRGA